MKDKFEKILKKIFLSSVGSIIATNGIQAVPYNLSKVENSNKDKRLEESKQKDNSLKHILKMYEDNSYLIAGHRSHRSHSSHQSHSSHSSHRSSSYGGSTQTPFKSTYNSSSNTETVSKIYSLGERSIFQGISGNDVRELANLLIKIGYITEKDLTKDVWGNITCCSKLTDAIKKFQKSVDLSIDGIAGRTTIQALKDYSINYDNNIQSLVSTPHYEAEKINLGDRVLKKGMKGTDVTQLKNILIDKGFLSASIAKGSTLFDNTIEKAVIDFQEKTGIDTDGIVDTQTAYFLKK